MPERTLIINLCNETIDRFIQDMPILLIACIRHIDNLGMLAKLEETAVNLGPSVRVCYALEPLLPYFENRYSVSGTPTFLIIMKGICIDALLGNQTAQDIIAWAKSVVKTYKNQSISSNVLQNRTPCIGKQLHTVVQRCS